MVKSDASSKNQAIRNLDELEWKAKELLPKDPDFKWSFASEHHAADQENTLLLNGHRFHPRFELRPQLSQLEDLAKDPSSLLITVYLPPRIVKECRDQNLSAIDLNGQVIIRKEGVFVDRQALSSNKYRVVNEPRNIFMGKSLSIIRLLLFDLDKQWKQSELIQETKASSGLVSRVVNHLVTLGYASKPAARLIRVSDAQSLIDAWLENDRIELRTRSRRYSTLAADPVVTARKLHQLAQNEQVEIAFTQWIAGWLRHPYTEPVVVSAYVSQFPGEDVLARIGLRPVPESGNICLYLPVQDTGIFQCKREVQGLPLVSDAQVVVDLRKAGLRAEEQAEALRRWEGFCRL